jgi:hypothetical protein
MRNNLAVGGIVLALLFAVMSIAGLCDTSTYARETAAWTEQAIAQDWFDLLIAVPALAAAGLWSSRGTQRGLVVYGGALLFAAYTAAIYAFAVHLNRVFLVYCAALGVAIYSLIGVAFRLSRARVGLSPGAPRKTASVFLIAVGVLFGLLWLAQLIPAAIHGDVPPELAATGLLTNPVHVIDLSFILPLHVIAGLALWRMRSATALLAPIVLVFGALMSASIGALTAYAGNTVLTVAMAAISGASGILAFLVVRSLSTRDG